MFIDAIFVKIREGQVANRPIYVVIGVTVDGERDILGIWAGEGGEGAKYWAHVLTEIKNRGVGDVCILVCDGLSGLPDAVGTVWPQTIVQNCVVHLLRVSFRYASRRDWSAIARDLKPIYTAPTEAAALERLADFAGTWEHKYPAIVKLWESSWAEFVPFLGFAPAVRQVIYTTNAIVILSLLEHVWDVADEGSERLGLGAGRGYLPRSSTQVPGRFGVRSEGGGARFAA